VLKKDFEPQMDEMSSKVKAALNSSASIRKEMSGKLEMVTELNDKMQKVEDILNSANFKIALTSDSLKTTRNSMEDFRKETEANLESMHAENAELKQYVWIALGAAGLLPVIVLVIAIILTGRQRKMLREHIDSMIAEMQKNRTDLKNEVQALKSGVDGEIYSAKAELNVKLMNMKEESDNQLKRITDETVAQLKEMAQKLHTKQDKNMGDRE
jgi:hypothetical protein